MGMGIIRRVGWGIRKSIRKDIRAARRRRAKWAAESRRQSAKNAAKARARSARKFNGPSCGIAHRTMGASLRCAQCNLGRARQAEKAALAAAENEAADLKAKQQRQAKATEQAAARAGFPDSRLGHLLAPDGSPKALPMQRNLVRSTMHKATGIRPSLKPLSIGGAEKILMAFDMDPKALWLNGRGSVARNWAAGISKWLVLVAAIILCMTPVVGWIIGAAVVILAIIAAVRAGVGAAGGVILLGMLLAVLMPVLHWAVGVALMAAPLVTAARRRKRQAYEDTLVPESAAAPGGKPEASEETLAQSLSQAEQATQ